MRSDKYFETEVGSTQARSVTAQRDNEPACVTDRNLVIESFCKSISLGGLETNRRWRIYASTPCDRALRRRMRVSRCQRAHHRHRPQARSSARRPPLQLRTPRPTEESPAVAAPCWPLRSSLLLFLFVCRLQLNLRSWPRKTLADWMQR